MIILVAMRILGDRCETIVGVCIVNVGGRRSNGSGSVCISITIATATVTVRMVIHINGIISVAISHAKRIQTTIDCSRRRHHRRRSRCWCRITMIIITIIIVVVVVVAIVTTINFTDGDSTKAAVTRYNWTS